MFHQSRRLFATVLVLFGATAGSGARAAASPAVDDVQVTTATWTLAAPVANEVLFRSGRQFTIVGGLDATKFSTAAVVRVNPASGVSHPVGHLTQAVHDAAGVRVGDTVRVLGGGGPTGNETAAVQLVGPDGRTSVVGQLPQPRSDHVAAAVDGTTYVLGGYDGANIVGDVVATVDGTSFSKVGLLPVPVRYPALAVVGKAIYLFGGVASLNGTDTAAIQRLDTTTGEIKIVGQLPTTVSHASAVVLGRRVYVLGGYVDNVRLSDQVLRVDPASGAANIVARLPEPNSDASAIVVDGRGYLVGGKSTARAPLSSVISVALRR